MGVPQADLMMLLKEEECNPENQKEIMHFVAYLHASFFFGREGENIYPCCGKRFSIPSYQDDPAPIRV